MTSALRIAVLLFAVLLGACTGQDVAREWVLHVIETDARIERLIADGDRRSAIVELTSLADDEAPNVIAADDARAVRQDAYYRLADLALEDGAADRAVLLAELGFALGDERDAFSANLYIVRGKAHEAQGEATEAARDFHEALLINDAMLDRVLSGIER